MYISNTIVANVVESTSTNGKTMADYLFVKGTKEFIWDGTTVRKIGAVSLIYKLNPDAFLVTLLEDPIGICYTLTLIEKGKQIQHQSRPSSYVSN